MSKREEWTFQYSAKDVLKAAQAKVAHHNERATWWKLKKTEVMGKIKEGGIDVHENIAASYQNFTKGAAQATVMIDPTLQKDLTEAVGKINQHLSTASEYQQWVDLLSGTRGLVSDKIELLPASTKALELTFDDYNHFFGK